MPDIRNRISMAAVLIAGLTVPAAAQTLDKTRVKQACRGDYLQFCKGVMPGGGRILNCLGGHMNELSPACRSVVVRGTACQADYQHFCPGIKPGSDGALMDCMKQHAKELSEACSHALAGNPMPAR